MVQIKVLDLGQLKLLPLKMDSNILFCLLDLQSQINATNDDWNVS